MLFTDVSHTLTALRQAADLGDSLHASIEILMPVVVPWPLPLSEPPVDTAVLRRRLMTKAGSAGVAGVPVRINLVHCRDRNEAIEKRLGLRSIVVMCWRPRWLFDPTMRFARRLARLGHHVIAAHPAKGD